MWTLLYDASYYDVYLLAGIIPVYDEICRRVMNFIQTIQIYCNSDSILIKYVVMELKYLAFQLFINHILLNETIRSWLMGAHESE